MTFSDAARLPIHGGAASTLDAMSNKAARLLERLRRAVSDMHSVGTADPTAAAEPIDAKVPLYPLAWPLISEADLNDTRKWNAALCSKDSTMLDRMLELCKGQEEKYAYLMFLACITARINQEFKNLTKIIAAMCMDLDRFQLYISHMVDLAMEHGDAQGLAAILEGIAGRMDQMPKDISKVLAKTVIIGSEDYRESAKKIHEHVTHIGLKELSVIAMITKKGERLAASIECLKGRDDWPQDLVEEMAKVTYEAQEYRTLELLLHMEPSNKNHLRRLTVNSLPSRIGSGNFDEADGLVRMFDISIPEFQNALGKVVGNCIYSNMLDKVEKTFEHLDYVVKVHDAMEKDAVSKCTEAGVSDALETIIKFLGNKPQEYKLAVDAALEGFTQQDVSQLDSQALKRYQRFQKWATMVKSHQEGGNPDHCNATMHTYGYIHMIGLLLSRLFHL